jgi:hypothetical protein
VTGRLTDQEIEAERKRQAEMLDAIRGLRKGEERPMNPLREAALASAVRSIIGPKGPTPKSRHSELANALRDNTIGFEMRAPIPKAMKVIDHLDGGSVAPGSKLAALVEQALIEEIQANPAKRARLGLASQALREGRLGVSRAGAFPFIEEGTDIQAVEITGTIEVGR